MAEPHISPLIPTSSAAIRMVQHEAAQQYAMQVESEQNLSQYCELSAFNPMQRMGQFKELHELRSSLLQGKAEEAEEVEEPKILKTEEVGETAYRFQKNNFELNAKTLLILRERISAEDTPEEVLNKVLSTYADPALADEALDFLIETADAQTLSVIKLAKEQLKNAFEREIKAGRNMGAQAREFSETGLGSPTSLRDMYRDITGTAREPLVLFEELTAKFRYEKMRAAIHFLLHSLGSDMRAKGPSIPRGELKRLIDEIRSLQGVLGVFRFFQSRMKMMHRQFASYHLVFPPQLNFELLARAFVKTLAERYLNSEKILQLAKILGVGEEIAAQIILYTQMRDALKQIAPRYFRNPQHRDELWKTYIETIEKLEDELEEEEEKEEQERKKREKNE